MTSLDPGSPAAWEPRVAIRIPPVATRFLNSVRREGVDDLGQPVKRVFAEGGEPCRDVLRRARAGEELVLASHTPFGRSGPYKEYGPVFVLAHQTDENVQRDVLPVHGPLRYLRDLFAIRAYSDAEEILDAALVTPADASATMERFFDTRATAFLHVRFPAYGCFACRVDRG